MKALVRRHSRYTIFFCLFLYQLPVFGQLTANFTSSTVSGCSPIVVQFTDSSKGSPLSWKWDLGNGTSSTLQNPSSTYFNPGNYTVRLIVSNANGSDTVIKQNLITVYASPVTAFIASDSSGCFPLTVRFTDKSLAGSGTIASWNWDFGDGTVSSEANPTHTYSAQGSYSVTLRVTNNFGCSKTYTHYQYINTFGGVKAGFTSANAISCSVPATVSFTNNSVAPSSSTYLWSFGDGSNSTQANPQHLYASAGNYNVSLLVTTPEGCRDSITKQNAVNIGTFSSKFKVPDTLCSQQPFMVINSSPGQPTSCLWNFGDGTTSTDINPVKAYATPGTYTISVLNVFGSCSDSSSKTVVVNARPLAAFSSSGTNSCQVPYTVQFTSKSLSATSVWWNFGDDSTSTELNPKHTYLREGSFTVTLVAINQYGCTDSLVKQNAIIVKRPGIEIIGLPVKGCAPQTISPTAKTLTGLPIATYSWNFGDGTTAPDVNPSHTYTKAGTYNVSLTIETTNGCTDSTVVLNGVTIGDKPHAGFKPEPTDVCAYKTVSFTDESIGNPDRWLWNFGDGGSSIEQNPTYQYSDTGWFNVKLVVWSNTCPDSITVNNAVHIKPPISAFNVKFDCTNKFRRDFVDKSIGAETWYWTFGDGTSSTEKNPNHNYDSTGSYKVELLVTNGTCSHSSSQTIQIINEKAAFATNEEVCRNSQTGFQSSNINAANIANWLWSFGDGDSSTVVTTTSHTYTRSGTYTAGLKITDLVGCSDSIYKQVKVFGPAADFKPSVSTACLSMNVISFTDSSKTDGTHNLTKWLWNYGDGTLDSTSAAPYKHSYNTDGSYDISLTVTDSYGCSDTKTRQSSVVIAQPHANFTADTISCIGKNIFFNNASSGNNLQYQWTLGDGSAATTISPVHAYTSKGSYSVQLSVKDQNGCKDTLKKANYILIVYPVSSFNVSDSFATCPPLMVSFANKATDYTSFQWDFGDGTYSTILNPSHYYTKAGVYYAKLQVTSAGGCTENFTRKIVIKGPDGNFSYTPLVGCTPLKVNFSASAKNAASFTWDFADGNTTQTIDSLVSHVYVNRSAYIPKLILTDAGGCKVAIQGPEPIQVKGVDAAVELNASKFCNSAEVQFTNKTTGNDSIKSYSWNFGDGSTSTETDPTHRYLQPGFYPVQMTATSELGCTSSIQLVDTIKVFRAPVISITGDSVSCVPANFRLSGQVSVGDPSTLSWQWTSVNGQTANTQTPTGFKYTKETTDVITAVVTDRNNCKDTTLKNVIVHPLPNTDAGPDQWICHGSVTQLQSAGADIYDWRIVSGCLTCPQTVNRTNTAYLSCSNCTNPLAAPDDSTIYVLTGTNSFGCVKEDTMIVRVHEPLVLKVSPGDTLCVGRSTHLYATGADMYNWTPSIGVTDPNSAFTTVTPGSSTLYHLTAKDAYNCFTDTASVFIKVWPIPTVQASADQQLVVGQSLQLHSSGSADVSSWKWTPAYNLSCATCADPKANPKHTTTYEVEVQNDGGCKNNARLTVFVTCNNGNLFLPNTFSPNKDGVNDRFYPRGSGVSMIKQLRIYNRWGEVVFEKINFNVNDASAGWDGSYKGLALAPDVYIYTCDVVCQNNELLSFKGDVSLIR
jgi:gliding motility-associated-like protein